MTDAKSAPDEAPDRSQLRSIIADLQDGVMLVEPDKRIVWANHAMLHMHGVSRLAELGATVAAYRDRFALRYRNGQALKTQAYPMDRLCRGEAFSDLVVEVSAKSNPEKQWVQCLRGQPLVDRGCAADCHVLIATDATEAFEAEERFERMFNANPAPAIIVRLADLRYVRANQGFLEMTGWRTQDIVGRRLYDVDILQGAERRELAKNHLSEWRTVPQMEAELPLPHEASKLVMLAGQPIEISGERCMLFTFADLEPRRQAETALRQSEETFAKSFRFAPIPMSLSSLNGHRILNVNHAFLDMTGWRHEEVIGRRPGEIELWQSSVTRREVEARLTQSGSFRGYELKVKTKAGDLIDCLVSAESVTINDERCVLASFQDIRERKRTEVELVAAIEAAMQDTSWLSQKIMDKLAAVRAPQGAAARAGATSADLTARERQVLALVAQGASDDVIATTLSLSRNTVRNHVARLYAKIGAHNRGEAIIWARDRGHSPKAVGKAGSAR
jgi:PAS domain S-box-containing protein